MPLVVDASVALAWALPDESSPYADAVLAVVEQEGLRVPELWAREIANGLAVAYLRKRITSADEKAFLAALSHLSIEVEETSAALTVIRDGTAAAIALWPNGLRCGVCRSCFAGKTDPSHSRFGHAQGCRTIWRDNFPLMRSGCPQSHCGDPSVRGLLLILRPIVNGLSYPR